MYDGVPTTMTTAAICASREFAWSPSFYRGEQYDSDLGLYYLRARYYNPNTGRFMSRDPENGKANDPQSLHKYLYAGGDPVNMLDPSWRDDEEEEAYIDLNVMSAATQFMLKKIACGIVAYLTKAALALGGITGDPAAIGTWGAGVLCALATLGGPGLGSGN